MKTLRHYLMESVRTYNYTIKILGDVENKNLLDMFIHNLSKFDPVKISDPKTTVIQKNPYGFPLEETNQSGGSLRFCPLSFFFIISFLIFLMDQTKENEKAFCVCIISS